MTPDLARMPASMADSLFVLVDIADPVLASRLRHGLERRGLILAAGRDEADVTLSDGLSDGLSDRDAAGVSVKLGGEAGTEAGHLPVEASLDQIEAALRAVALGLVVRSALAVSRFRPVAEPGLGDLLTPREVAVLERLSEGLSNKAIARRLDISLHTVKFHVEAIFRKLDAHSRAEAVAKGLKRRQADEIRV